MKGYELNPDKEYVQKIIEGIYRKDGHCPCRLNVIEGIYRKDGHCPCRLNVDDTTLCPCDEFVQKQVCKCNLFVKRQSEETYKNSSTPKKD